MVKQALIILALVGLAFSDPQPRKLFHEHFDDFVNIIAKEAGDQLDKLIDRYLQYDEFSTTLQYIQSNKFKNIVYEMESLAEFKAVMDFLENDNIDIHCFLNIINDIIENYHLKRNSHYGSVPSNKDLSSFIQDSISLFPQKKLAALYHEKMANDKEFHNTIVNLQSDEWGEVFSALWDCVVFIEEVKTLKSNGIDIHEVLNEIVAIFGQNKFGNI